MIQLIYKLRLHFLALTVSTISLAGSISSAYFEVLNSADVTNSETYRGIVGPQFIVGNNSGVNINGHFDVPYNQDSDMRLTFGAGKVDFHFGGFFKWAPIPDTKGQPAMGVIAGGTYANFDGSNQFTFKVAPIVSKKFDTDIGKMNPYVSLPLGYLIRSGDNQFPFNFTFGSEWKPKGLDWKGVTFMAEMGFELNESFSHFSFAAVFDIDKIDLSKRN